MDYGSWDSMTDCDAAGDGDVGACEASIVRLASPLLSAPMISWHPYRRSSQGLDVAPSGIHKAHVETPRPAVFLNEFRV